MLTDRVSHQFWALSLMAVFLSGCGSAGDGRQTAPVSGTVTLDGIPLAGANVHFMSQAEQFTGFAVTDELGRYTLVQGAVPGPNRVFISKVSSDELVDGMFAGDLESGLDTGQLMASAATDDPTRRSNAADGAPPGEMIAADFSDPQKSKLSHDVSPNGNDGVDFNL